MRLNFHLVDFMCVLKPIHFEMLATNRNVMIIHGSYCTCYKLSGWYEIYSIFFSVGTHGYMAPEVLSKGTAYDSSADWFSFGCMLYKLLKGHSPFRQHKTKDKHEIDRMTLTMNVELPDTFSLALRQLLEGLLQVGMTSMQFYIPKYFYLSRNDFSY